MCKRGAKGDGKDKGGGKDGAVKEEAEAAMRLGVVSCSSESSWCSSATATTTATGTSPSTPATPTASAGSPSPVGAGPAKSPPSAGTEEGSLATEEAAEGAASVRDIDQLLEDEENDDEEEDEEELKEEDDDDDEDDEQRVGYSAMLNALDGALANNQGLTIVMTTNKYEKMMADPEYRETLGALFRPGRVDLRASFDRPDASQMQHAVEAVFGGDDSEHPPEAVRAACEQLPERWPMRRQGERAVSKYSYSKLKSHLMRFGQKEPGAAISAANIGDFKWRLAVQKLDERTRRLEAWADALRFQFDRLKQQSRYIGFEGRDRINELVDELEKELRSAQRVERRLSRKLTQLDSIAATVPPSIATILHDSLGLARTTLEGVGKPMRKAAKVIKKERMADAKEKEEEAAALAAAEAAGAAEGDGAAKGGEVVEGGEEGEEAGGNDEDEDDDDDDEDDEDDDDDDDDDDMAAEMAAHEAFLASVMASVPKIDAPQ